MYSERAPSPVTVQSSSVLLANRPVAATKPTRCTNCARDYPQSPCEFICWAVACRLCNTRGIGGTCSFRVPVESRTALIDVFKRARQAQSTVPANIDGLAQTVSLLGLTRQTVEAKLHRIEVERGRLLSELTGIRVSDEFLTSDLVRLLDDDLNADFTHCPPDSLLVLTGGTYGFAVPGVRRRTYANQYLKDYLEGLDDTMDDL